MGYKGEIPATHYGEVNTHLDVGPGVVYWIVGVPSSSDWEFRIRDGRDTGADTIMRCTGETEQTTQLVFNPPLPYKRGLFVHMVDDMLGFIIAYDHLES